MQLESGQQLFFPKRFCCDTDDVFYVRGRSSAINYRIVYTSLSSFRFRDRQKIHCLVSFPCLLNLFFIWKKKKKLGTDLLGLITGLSLANVFFFFYMDRNLFQTVGRNKFQWEGDTPSLLSWTGICFFLLLASTRIRWKRKEKHLK